MMPHIYSSRNMFCSYSGGKYARAAAATAVDEEQDLLISRARHRTSCCRGPVNDPGGTS